VQLDETARAREHFADDTGGIVGAGSAAPGEP
jgi:hypothetical protein